MRITTTLRSALTVLLLTSTVLAQSRGVVRLKNGGRVAGELMEVLPGDHVSIKLADGTSRSFPWAEVERVDEPTASQPAPGEPAPGGVTQGEGDAEIVFRSTKPGAILQEITGHAMAVSVGYRSTVTTTAESWRNLCEAPCTYRLPAGFHELRMEGPGPIGRTKITLQPGTNHVLGKPGNTGVWVTGLILFSLGLSFGIGGGILYGTGAAIGGSGSDKIKSIGLPMLIGGGVATAVGIPLWIAGSSDLDRDPHPGTQARGPMLRWSGTF